MHWHLCLWRLPQLGIDIPASANALHDYMRRLFAKDSFQSSLTEAERQLSAGWKNMTSNKPYFIRAIYDWIVDNDFTPYILVNATLP